MGVHIESAARHPSTIGVVRRDFRPDLPGAADLWMPVVLL
ncbi:Acyl-phosphate:glycerol-3-phosphate O-acyltransferase PlsY [Salmonella enterica subsp. enterica serovar Typhimurium]|nr:Acyl-phosphate:glycerol-3-phosphate O-acyltransferase PlsY [Salmonella enterica subsp. enterica serovar Typhimurium]